MEAEKLIEKAEIIYKENFPAETWFERAVFFSWYCGIRDCAYCYMSTQPKVSRKGFIPRRSEESILAETLLCKEIGWRLGFFSGGIGAYTAEGFRDILKKVAGTYGEKIWVNAGPLKRKEMEDYSPHMKGVVGSIETVNPEVHGKVCPSKPVEPYLDMFEEAKKLGLKNAMTIIIGLGETIEDFGMLKKMIKEYSIEKIHFYGLNPQKRTIFENSEPPKTGYQAEWIARTRIDFPKIDIQCGIWTDRVNAISLLLRAGANSISKFPAIRRFGTREAEEIELQAKKAGRKFKGTLTRLPEKKVYTGNMKIQEKIEQYMKSMAKNVRSG